MKKAFLLIVVPALLVALGLAQTPAASSNTDQTNIRGCLGGSDDNYTVAEDNTGQIFKITTSSVDLKLHLGHEVKLVGHKASGAVSPSAADNSLAVTELSMISEHCAGAAAAPVATVSASPDTVITPAAPAAATPAAAPVGAPSEIATTPPAAPAATAVAPNATVNAPAAETSAPAATVNTPASTVNPSSETVSTPPAAPAAETSAPAATINTPTATVRPSSETVSTPAAATAHPTRPLSHPRRQLATPAAAADAATPAATVTPHTADAATPAATATPHTADAATPAATASTPSETDSTPSAAATAPTVTHKGGSLWLFVPFVVLLIALGTLVPLLNRWRKRKLLEQANAQDLSLTHKPSSDPGKSDTPVVVRKAA